MKYHCITSMTQGHINGIGGVMLEGWLKYWPKNCTLTIYAEGWNKISLDSRVSIIDWAENCQTDWEIYCGMQTDDRSRRFAKKGFAFSHAMRQPQTAERLLWLDADLIFKQSLPESVLEQVLPPKKLIAMFDCFYQANNNYTPEQYIDRTVRKQFGAESGFVMIDTQHPRYTEYIAEYYRLFTTPKDASFTSWYDGEVVLSAAKEFLTEVEDLSRHRRTNKTQTPINHCFLSDYMGHIKAKTKKHFTHEQLRQLSNLT